MRGMPPYFQAKTREVSATEKRGGEVFRKGRLGLIGGGSRQLGEESTGERLSML